MSKSCSLAISLSIAIIILLVFPISIATTGYYNGSILIAADANDTATSIPSVNATAAIVNNVKPTVPPVTNSSDPATTKIPSSQKPGGLNKADRTTVSPDGKSSNMVTNNRKTLPPIASTSSKPTVRLKPWFNQLTLQEFLGLNDRYWADIPINFGIWCLFIGLALICYLFKLKNLRQPLLFLGVILFGFYMGGVPDPISAIFEVVAKNQIWLNLILVLIPIGLSLFGGRFFCGWICPLGAVQEFLHPAPEARSLPQPLDRVLKYLKLVILVIVAYLTWHNFANVWHHYNPTQTLFTFSGSLTTVIILAVILLISVLISRPFCKYLCPLAAILAITSKFTPFRMRADTKKCMVCGKCRQGECPMDAISAFNPEIDLPGIDNSECIKCFRCQKNCRNAALRVSGFKIDHAYSSASEQDKLTGNYD